MPCWVGSAKLKLSELQAEFVRAGRWEADLEESTAASQQRLRESVPTPPILVPPAPPGGTSRDVVGHVAATSWSDGWHLSPRAGVGVMAHYDMEAWLQRTRLVVCVGAGGVGKTTTAATLGLCGALRGRKVMVLTIDPARRLANSLGLASIGNQETKIDLANLGFDTSGELWAMMLDSRSSFDALIRRVASDEGARQRILDNHVYRHMADTFAGSQDYMATEALYDVVSSGKYDLVVLDTPPVKNALDFLESPGRLINFLDERVLRWFLRPYDPNAVFGRSLLMGTSAVVYRLLAYVFGRHFLDDLAQFFQDFQGLYEGFVHRNQAVVDLFRGRGYELCHRVRAHR